MAHVAKILYHWRMHPNSTAANPQSKSYCHVAGQKAIQDHLDRVGVKGEVIMSEVFCTYRVKYERRKDFEGYLQIIKKNWKSGYQVL